MPTETETPSGIKIEAGKLHILIGSPREADLQKVAQALATQKTDTLSPVERSMITHYSSLKMIIKSILPSVVEQFQTLWDELGEEEFSVGADAGWSQDMKDNWNIFCMYMAIKTRLDSLELTPTE